DAWPFDKMKRSRFGQIGSSGSKRMVRFQIVYTTGASAIGVPGCPDLACWTASIARVRIVLIANCTIFSSVTGVSFRMALLAACFQGSHFAQAPQVALVLAKRGGQERLDEVPGYGRSYSPAAHADKVHMIALAPLLGREVVVNDRGADARDLVGTDRCTNAAPTDRHATLSLSRHHSPRQRDHEVRIVVAPVQAM